jgi:ATP-dependent Clp protease ATP-binding subunit ClpA
MIKIVGKFMVELKDQIKDKGIKIKLKDDAVDLLVKKGFDNKMGARPLQRVIDKEIKRPLAKMMLFGELRNGGILTIGTDADNIILSAKPKIMKLEYNVETQSQSDN